MSIIGWLIFVLLHLCPGQIKPNRWVIYTVSTLNTRLRARIDTPQTAFSTKAGKSRQHEIICRDTLSLTTGQFRPLEGLVNPSDHADLERS